MRTKSDVHVRKSRVQRCGETLVDNHGFIGVPRETFDTGGRRQFVALLNEGLSPESKVLEIGCGALRVAYWLIRFLDPGHYHGIEPAEARVSLGKRYLFTPEELGAARPRFDHNAGFDTSVFGTRFDFVLAGSIWTHCSKKSIEVMLDGFLRDSAPDGVFLTSYLEAESENDDYRGDAWVGTSHESDVSGVVRHAWAWLEAACHSRGLRVTKLPGHAFDGQRWLRVEREDAPPNPQRQVC